MKIRKAGLFRKLAITAVFISGFAAGYYLEIDDIGKESQQEKCLEQSAQNAEETYLKQVRNGATVENASFDATIAYHETECWKALRNGSK